MPTLFHLKFYCFVVNIFHLKFCSFVVNNVALVLWQLSVDSGQGGSNGPPTPPDKRLDAVTTLDDSTVVVYEFDFPTDLCGMLIGRFGRNINAISRESGALISVRQKQFSHGLQSVRLQGEGRVAVYEV